MNSLWLYTRYFIRLILPALAIISISSSAEGQGNEIATQLSDLQEDEQWQEIMDLFDLEEIHDTLLYFKVEAALKKEEYFLAREASVELLVYFEVVEVNDFSVARAHFWRGEVAYANAEYQDALIYFKKAFELYGEKNRSVLKFTTKQRIAYLYLQSSQYRLADSLYRENVDYAQRYHQKEIEIITGAIRNLAFFYDRTNAREKALKILQNVDKDWPEDWKSSIEYANVLSHLGVLYTRSKDFDNSYGIGSIRGCRG